jgi:ubiquinone/menaquinone biosynthesis C-methylase UbiE
LTNGVFYSEILVVLKKRVEYPGLTVTNGQAEKHFDFYDVRMRGYYLDALKALLEMKDLEGKVLDIGGGPGVFGMMLCDRTEFTTVVELEQSGLLVRIGEAISSRNGYGSRISFKTWDGDKLPFEDNTFDAVVSLLSFHRWKNPAAIFPEIERVRKKDSVAFIRDFRRDQAFLPLYTFVQQIRFAMGREIAVNLLNSFKASYTTDEMGDVIKRAGLSDWRLEKNGRLLTVTSPSAGREN